MIRRQAELMDSAHDPARVTGTERADPTMGRRAMLQYSALGGAGLVAAVVGNPGTTEASPYQSVEAGPQRPVMTGRARRVVTGYSPAGRSYIVSDQVVDIADLWATTADKPLGEGPLGEEHPFYTRATGESLCFMATIAPSSDPKPTLANRIGFHVSRGVAYVFVLTGEIFFLVDEEEVLLKAGDLLVERGTDHSWRNEGSAPVGMFITVVRAEA